MKTIYINHQGVELYKILKFENLVYGGGEAKMAIANGYVLVNDQVETQKRKKINAGDTIEFDGERFLIQLGEASEETSFDTAQAISMPTESQPVVAKPKRSAIKF